jgi:hypothetical protein
METKRWGPFTGRQLTTIIVGVLLAIALPVAANATSTGQDVVITDPTASPERYAKVDQFGKLQVGDNHLKTDILGNLKVAPQYGNVIARRANVEDGFNAAVGVGTTGTQLAAAGGTPLVITSLHASTSGVAAAEDTLVQIVGPKPDCAVAGGFLLDVVTVENTTVNLDYEPGILIPAGQRLCAHKHASDYDAVIGVSGYVANA